MTDICTRLRRWAIAADAVPASDLMDEAAAAPFLPTLSPTLSPAAVPSGGGTLAPGVAPPPSPPIG